MSEPPPRVDEKAMCKPSGDQEGSSLSPVDVSTDPLPPSAGIVTNEMFVSAPPSSRNARAERGNWRRRTAEQQGQPPYVIMSNELMLRIAETRPKDEDALLPALLFFALGGLANEAGAVVGEITAHGALAEGELVLLEDDRGLQPAENVVPVVRAEVLESPLGRQVSEALDDVSARLTTTDLRFLNWRVDVAGNATADEARGWLIRHGLVDRADG